MPMQYRPQAPAPVPAVARRLKPAPVKAASKPVARAQTAPSISSMSMLAAHSSSTQSLADELTQLAELRMRGLLNDAEFSLAKARILAGGNASPAPAPAHASAHARASAPTPAPAAGRTVSAPPAIPQPLASAGYTIPAAVHSQSPGRMTPAGSPYAPVSSQRVSASVCHIPHPLHIFPDSLYHSRALALALTSPMSFACPRDLSLRLRLYIHTRNFIRTAAAPAPLTRCTRRCPACNLLWPRRDRRSARAKPHHSQTYLVTLVVKAAVRSAARGSAALPPKPSLSAYHARSTSACI